MTIEKRRPQRATDLGGVDWIKSSYSGGSESQCVETADLTGTPFNAVAIRDSKMRNGSVLLVTPKAFAAFTAFVSEANHRRFNR
ncbi:DUF397 domain-containing protein [Streptomyces sp. NPDC001795]|uniref:DUF397 domain-containing protein n=1 Tax=Streptomyces sp. NPDC001795 TaxID=3154525 RepID=UPI003323F3CC